MQPLTQAGEQAVQNLSQRYGVSVDAIRRDNGLKKNSVLRAGVDLTIPRSPDAK